MATKPEDGSREDDDAIKRPRRPPTRWWRRRISAETGLLLWHTIIVMWVTVETFLHWPA
jgi:hypothetical protein